MNLLDKIKQNPEEISFDEVIAYIDEHYDLVPTAFQNGEVFNEEKNSYRGTIPWRSSCQ